jgi:hypothetical protein
MASVSAVQATFGSQAVGIAFSRFWFQELLDATSRQAAVDSVRALLVPLATLYMQTGWTIQVEQKIQNFDLTTGQLASEVNAGTKPTVIAGAVANTSAWGKGVGARILWSTGVVIAGRKVVGRAFLIPLVAFQNSNGDVASPLISSMATAITTYVTQPSARPCVWHKTFSKPTDGTPPVYTGGNAVVINGGVVPASVSSLRSRRY